MEKATITLTIDAEKMTAMETFLHKESSSVQKRMDEALQKLYMDAVPDAVREYIEIKSSKPRRSASRPRTSSEAATAADAEDE